MEIIQNKWINKFIPFPGFRCVNLFGVLFVRGEKELSASTLNHEAIHTAQWKELLYIGFILWYVIEWIIRLIICWNTHDAYRNMSFEREAYDNDQNLSYLQTRKRFAFIKHIK